MTTSDIFGEDPTPRKRLGKGQRKLLAQRRLDVAMEALPMALKAIAATRPANDQHEKAFRQAHDDLAETYEMHARGTLTKEALFAAYDRRLLAGHAWHPHREAYRTAKAWFDAIQEEIELANLELGSKS